MHSKVALVLLGLVAISSARDYARSRPAASRGSYASLKTEQYEPVEVEEVKSAAPAVSYTKTESDYTYTVPTRKQSQSSTAAVDREANERVAHEQNLNAKYTFASAVNDGIMDQSQVRQETRDGLKVTGSYSYTDGFIKKTVHYTADEDGYRVDKEEVESIGSGPETDLVNGKADVHSQGHGIDTQYSITAHDIALLTKDGKVKLTL